MTMPDELERAHRFMHEFLTELRTAPNLTPNERSLVCEILQRIQVGDTRLAREFVKTGSVQLTPEQNRQRPYVLRHYPMD